MTNVFVVAAFLLAELNHADLTHNACHRVIVPFVRVLLDIKETLTSSVHLSQETTFQQQNVTVMTTVRLTELAKTKSVSTHAAFETLVGVKLSAMLKTTKAFADAQSDTTETQKLHAHLSKNLKQAVDQIRSVNSRNPASTNAALAHAIAETTPTVLFQTTTQCVHVNQAIQAIHSLGALKLDVKMTDNVPMTKRVTTANVSIHVQSRILAQSLLNATEAIIELLASVHQAWKEIHL